METSFTQDEAYLVLKDRLGAAGILKRTPIAHLAFTAFVVLVYCGLFVSIFYIDPVLAVGVGALLAFPMLWLGFLAHDIAHGQVFQSKKIQTIASVFLWNMVGGISARLWEENHGAHHQHTNVVGKDPDMHMPFIFSDIQQRHPTKAQMRWSPFLRRHQHIYFFILFPLVYSSYVIHSIPRILNIKSKLRMLAELLFFIVHFVVFLSLIFLALGPLWGALFVMAHALSLGIIMSLVFAPNHKGMPMLSPNERVTHRTQIASTRNIHPSFVVDFLYGGLNYQIEHHLFPYVSRFYMPRARVLVQNFCREQGIPYYETTPLQSLRDIHHSLKSMS